MADLFGEQAVKVEHGIYVDPVAVEVYLSGERLGAVMGCSPMTISRWARERGLPRHAGPRNSWLYPILKGLVPWQLQQLGSDTTTESEAKRDLWTAQRRRTELDIAEREGDLVPREEFDRTLAAVGMLWREMLAELPDAIGQTDRRLADQVEIRCNEYRDLLVKRVRSVFASGGDPRAARRAATTADALRVAGTGGADDAAGEPAARAVGQSDGPVPRGAGKGRVRSKRARRGAGNTGPKRKD